MAKILLKKGTIFYVKKNNKKKWDKKRVFKGLFFLIKKLLKIEEN